MTVFESFLHLGVGPWMPDELDVEVYSMDYDRDEACEESGLTLVDLTLVVVHEAVRKAADME